MGSLRTPKARKKYLDAIAGGALDKGCVLCSKTSLKTFTFWKIIKNDFPYDRIAKTHHMLVPLRHVTEPELSEDEYNELLELKKDALNQDYNYLLEATPKTKSIPEHFHIHLIETTD